jgi:hypothetical protein
MIDSLYIIQQGLNKAKEDPMYISLKSNKAKKRLRGKSNKYKKPCTLSPMPKKGHI